MERKDIEELIDIGVLEAKLEVTEKRLAFVLGISLVGLNPLQIGLRTTMRLHRSNCRRFSSYRRN